MERKIDWNFLRTFYSREEFAAWLAKWNNGGCDILDGFENQALGTPITAWQRGIALEPSGPLEQDYYTAHGWNADADSVDYPVDITIRCVGTVQEVAQ